MTYKYLKKEWKEGEESFFFELDSEGITMRQIVGQKESLLVSNRPDFCLSEAPIDVKYGILIPQNEFQELWELGNKPYRNEWIEARRKLKEGMELEGQIEVIYPQGIIIDLGGGRYGITDYEECRRVSGAHKIYPGNKIKGKISGFDDSNLWIVMKDPEVNGK
ncbi:MULTISPECIES: S1 domain-containing protein [Paenibacillus]|uniref:hypothetical protein n=1 Tax=Paenibacillus TaxID=44249 RepID=UPI0022B86851|nr:hypothetical protein [Paenibacillus caseinilyticus]MCZ8517928.1 hypothetical protein [Paenibacillus caseinilyticus]